MGVSPIVIEAGRQAVGWVSYLVKVLLVLDCVPVALLGSYFCSHLVSHAKEWLG